MMRRAVLALAVLALAAGGALVWYERGPAQPRSSPSWSGYVEADYVMIACTLGGTLTALDVARGDSVAAGARVFTVDDRAERGARDEAAAKLRQAQAQLADLQTGRRPPEIQAIKAQRDQAAAMLRQSEAELRRQEQLRASVVANPKALDDARAARDRDRGHLDELEAQLRVARLPGRDEQIRAAEAAIAAANAALVQSDWRLGQMILTAPVAGTVIDTYYRVGETAPAGQPVVELLPPENLKIRFYVPEPALGQLAIGARVTVVCDGCGAAIPAVIRFIAPQAEYTPPVIYSREERARLVYMVEARPVERLDRLHVGAPVDVRLAPP